ncbi:MAG: NAD(P)H-quinone oxidoreductase subunit 3 [Moorella sp. (in: firmicutes)]|nr:NAD(P)H-quinone oxidoreductase subunit 3 [Moorella sp. (in: firmicutes)]
MANKYVSIAKGYGADYGKEVLRVLQQYGIIAIFLAGGAATAIAALATNWLLRPRGNAVGDKVATYECGLDTRGPTWVQFKVSYFLYALVFLLFDVETVFLYPWAVRFQVLGLFAFIEMIIFIAILVIGLWYAWKEGALKWL